jgi:spore germination protein YaaH
VSLVSGTHPFISSSAVVPKIGRTKSKSSRSTILLSQDEGLDGIDLDFEGIRSHVEWNAYLSYLSTASAALHQHDLIVTVALHPGHYLPKEICTALDRVHVMTYDMIRPNARRLDHHHASMRWAMDALEKFVQNGCPPYKLVMGIPAYGRHERDMGLVRTYSEIVDEMLMNGEDNDKIDEIDELEARIKRIRSVDSWDGYRFDSPDDVRAKVEYVTRNGFGGIFIWELGQDKRISGLAKGGMLLEAAAAAVNNYVGDESHDEL